MNVFNTKILDRIINLLEKCYYILLILILILSAFNMFYNLGNVPIDSWDEARHGVSAYEMMRRNDYIVNTYTYKNDYWNLKPPISYWAIVLGYKMVGFNPLGLRIFSAFAAILTIFIISIYCLYAKGRIASLVSASVLTTTIPYITEHCARTGDADSIYVLFFTIAILCLSLIEKSKKWIYGYGLAFAFAFLTKSWHAGSIAVIGIIYLLFSKLLFKFKIRHIIALILSASIPVVIWLGLRYPKDGLEFLKNMIGYDLMARTSTCLEGHVGGVCYYVEHLQVLNFYWAMVLMGILIALVAFLHEYKENNRFVSCVFTVVLWIAFPFLFYTIAKTKITWYILPIFPAMAVVIGVGSDFLLKEKNRNIISQILIMTILAVAIYKNEALIKERILTFTENPNQELFKEVGANKDYKGRKIYMQNCVREQNLVLTSELYADLKPSNDGLEGFLKDNTKKSLLLMTKDEARRLGDKISKLKLVFESRDVYIFTK